MKFAEQLTNAYKHLYDLVYLRTDPLAELLVADPTLSRKDRAWQLHYLLQEAIDELDPGPDVRTFSPEWRRHRLMVLRYVDGLDPQSVADQLAIGRRHYYREENSAIEAIARILWDRYTQQAARSGETPQAVGAEQQIADEPELMRVEAARMAQTGRYTTLQEVIAELQLLLDERLTKRNLTIEQELPRQPRRIGVERGLLRQVLLALLGYLIERAVDAKIRVSARPEGCTVVVRLTAEPPSSVRQSSGIHDQDRLSALDELAEVCGVPLLPLLAEGYVIGFEIQLLVGPQMTVLAVDDNKDMLELLSRYLGPHGFRLVAACSVDEALELAVRLQPQVITLDLMMPERDGWDLLHRLSQRHDTADIPVVVLSVLSQAELALSLGATAFLRKPVSEQALLDLLEDLAGRQPRESAMHENGSHKKC